MFSETDLFPAQFAGYSRRQQMYCALIYREPERPTVRAWGMRSAVLVTYRPVAPRSNNSAEAMMARKMRSMGVHRGIALGADKHQSPCGGRTPASCDHDWVHA